MDINVSDFWSDLPLVIKDLIEQAKSELNSGEGISHEQIMSEIRERYSNGQKI